MSQVKHKPRGYPLSTRTGVKLVRRQAVSPYAGKSEMLRLACNGKGPQQLSRGP
jgi:hypothetical protein